MSAYFIGNVKITNAEEYQKYASQTPAVIAKYGGRFLVRGGKVEFAEGVWGPDKWVMLEFPTMEALKRWYDSEDYQRIIGIRKRSTQTNAVAVEGVGTSLPNR